MGKAPERLPAGCPWKEGGISREPVEGLSQSQNIMAREERRGLKVETSSLRCLM